MSNFQQNQQRRDLFFMNPTSSSWNADIPPLLPLPRHDYADNGGFQKSRFQMMSNDIETMKNENGIIKTYLYDLQTDRNKLRTAVHKLKVENGRLKAKLKRVNDVSIGDDVEELSKDIDYEIVDKFLLVGGIKDPFDLQYPVPVNDSSNLSHKSGESYLWYKMAELFDDSVAMQAILTAEGSQIDEILNNIKNYDRTIWDAGKLKFFEDYQRLKFAQHRPLKCLLIASGKEYLALACQDKIFGTGWRKQRSEADRPQMWDGQNLGGKILMKLREEFTSEFVWNSPDEEEETKQIYADHCQKNTWKRIRTKRRASPQQIRNIDDGTSQFYGEGYTSFVDQPPETAFHGSSAPFSWNNSYRGQFRGRRPNVRS